MSTETKLSSKIFKPDQIRQQLDSILNSNDFKASESISTFLRFVVDEALAGRENQIKGYTIAVRAFGRPPDFDPQLDSIIRIQARRLRRALEIYYLTEGREDSIRITIPKGSYVPRFQHKADDMPGQSTAAQNGTPDKGSGIQSASNNLNDQLPTELSLAVLPFVNLSPDEADTYFAAGLTEEFAVALTRFPNFVVIGPLNKLGGRQVGLRQIGREYSVRFVLQGTVRKRGQTIRISVKLGETSHGRNLWADTFDYDLDSVGLYAIEDNVTNQVAATIADDFGVIPRRLFDEIQQKPVENSSVTEAILRYHYFNTVGTSQALAQAIKALELAYLQAPDNSHILATLADSYFVDDFVGYNLVANALNQAEEMAQQALAQNPKSQMAHIVLASVHASRGRKALCVAECHKAAALNPHNAHKLGNCGYLLAMMGEWGSGLALMRKAMELNPHYPSMYHHVAFMNYYRQEMYEEALVEANRVKMPDLMIDPITRAATLGQLGRDEEAQAALAELLALVPDFTARIDELKRRLFFTDENAEMLLDGLRRAGLTLEA